MGFWKTTGAAKELGVPCTRLYSLLRRGQLAPPAKDSSGDYVWLPGDMQRAREALSAGRKNEAG
jgi:hypothetical protein